MIAAAATTRRPGQEPPLAVRSAESMTVRVEKNPGAHGAPALCSRADGVAFGGQGWVRGAGGAYEARVAIVLGERRTGMSRLAGAAIVLSAVVWGSASCAGAAPPPPRRADPPLVARAEPAPPGTSVLAGAPDTLAAGVARALFSSAPVVVVADAGQAADVSAAAA